MAAGIDHHRPESLNTRRVWFILGVLAMLFGIFWIADANASKTGSPLAPLDVSNPSATLRSFIIQAQDIEVAYLAYRADPDHAKFRLFEDRVRRATTLFDASNLPHAVQIEVAGASFGFLYDILLRLPPEDLAQVLDAAPDSEPQSPWLIPNTEIAIFRIEEGEQAGSWLFSPRTLARLPDFHRAIINHPLQQESAVDNWHLAQSNLSGPFFSDAAVDRLPSRLRRTNAYDTPLWKLVLTFLIWLMIAAAVLLWMQFIGRLITNVGTPGQMLGRLSSPILLIIMVMWSRNFALTEISLTGGGFVRVERTITLLVIYLAAAWAARRTVLLVVETIIATSSIRSNLYHANLFRLIGKVLSVTSMALLVIVGLNEVGIPALGLLAGLGFGGFAIALAGKSTLENLLGGLTLFADKPFRVGDFVNYQEGVGVVEDIGPRSSRLRGRDGTLTTVPNNELVTARITNYTTRDKCLFLHTLGIRYETTPDQLKWLLHDIRKKVSAHPLVEESTGMPRVRLIGFGESAIKIEVRANVLTTNYSEFLEVQQDLLFEIMRLVERAGSRLATQTQTVLFGRDGGLESHARDRASRAGRMLRPDKQAHPDKQEGPMTPEGVPEKPDD